MDTDENVIYQQEDDETPLYYVGIGASAGGLEAIDSFISNMANDSDMAFIIVQHLSPDYKSLMVELLSKYTNMEVLRAENQMKVEKNKIYLIPPKKNLTIFHGKLMLTNQDRSFGGINLPIDIFLKSLAEDQQNRAIAIILSGTGSDGMRGVRIIKEQGGMVMVQTEDSAKFDGMPRSAISTGLSDFILPPEEMPKQILSFIKHPYAAQQKISNSLLTDEDGLTRIFYLLREKCKVDFTFYKPSTVIRRLERRMTVNQIYELKDYVHYLEQNAVEVDNLFRELLIGVTRFFRDDKAFELLLKNYLPELISSKKGNELRVWVSACSTGEEAYSIAIYCREVMDTLGISKKVKIFATDVDEKAIQLASQGLYAESIIADVPAEYTSKYFFHKDERFQISRAIREMVVFAKHDVLKDPPFTNIDFVSCRNLLIYFQPVLQKRAIEMFNFALNPNGILFLGSSETIGDLSALFETVDGKERIYRSFGKRHANLDNDQMGKFSSRPQLRPLRNNRESRIPAYVSAEEKALERFVNLISNLYIPLTIIVNDELEIMHVIGDAQGYLSIPTGKMKNSLIKMARKELSIPLATGIPKVFKTNTELRYSNINLQIGNELKIVHLNIHPLETLRTQQPLAAVFFETENKNKENQSATETSYDVSKETEHRIADLEQELQYSRENLQATVEELETSNEELQATNEELLASNEELQSTNEELQSVNEELYTVNAEHQSKIIELTELNNDLDNLLISTDIATVFLDEDFELRKFTPHVNLFFKVLDNDIGRPISHIPCELENINIVELLTGVKDSNNPIEKEVKTVEGLWYLMRILPYHIGPNVSSGVVITFISIHELKMVQNQLSESVERFNLAQQATDFGVWDWNLKSKKLFLSEFSESLFGLETGEFNNTIDAFMSLVHPDDVLNVQQALENSVEENSNYHEEYRIIWPNGAVRWLNAYGQVHRDGSDKAVRLVGIVSDITMQKQTENRLVNAEQTFRMTLENLHMSVVQLDFQGNIIFINDYLLKLTGWENTEVTGKDWFDLFVPEQDREQLRQQHIAYMNGKGKLSNHEKSTLLCKDGKQKPIWWNNTPLLNKEGEPIGINAIGELKENNQ